VGGKVIKCYYPSQRVHLTAMVVYIFEHIQWRWALNDFTAHG
jgi:hypothetical protein